MHFINRAAFAIVGVVFASVLRALGEVEPPSEERALQNEGNSMDGHILA